MTPTLLEQLVASQTFWGILGLAALAGLTNRTTQMFKAWHAHDAKDEEPHDEPDHTWCDTHGHAYAADPNGWHCANCPQIVRFPLTCAYAVPPDVCAVCVQRRTCEVHDQTKESA